MKDNVTINIYGGNNQVIPDVKEVEQQIYTEDGETVIINKFKLYGIHRGEHTQPRGTG